MTQQVNLAEKSIAELKALAYDQIVLMETAKRNIAIIEQEIGRRDDQPEIVSGEQSADVGEQARNNSRIQVEPEVATNSKQ